MFLQDQRRYKGKDLPIRTSCPEEQLPTRVNWAEKSPATRSRPGHTHGGLQAAVASAKPILWSHVRPRVSCPEPAHPWRSPPHTSPTRALPALCTGSSPVPELPWDSWIAPSRLASNHRRLRPRRHGLRSVSPCFTRVSLSLLLRSARSRSIYSALLPDGFLKKHLYVLI